MSAANTVRLDREVRRGDDTHAVFAAGGLAFTIGYGRLPARCPFRPGDWVQMHGHPGPTGDPFARYGFRGYVLGGMGSSILRGITDDGREWFAHSGHLVADGKGDGSAVGCTCCPDPRYVRLAAESAREAARPWDLLDLLAEMELAA